MRDIVARSSRTRTTSSGPAPTRACACRCAGDREDRGRLAPGGLPRYAYTRAGCRARRAGDRPQPGVLSTSGASRPPRRGRRGPADHPDLVATVPVRAADAGPRRRSRATRGCGGAAPCAVGRAASPPRRWSHRGSWRWRVHGHEIRTSWRNCASAASATAPGAPC
jgi:hypothetical protein